MATKVGGGGYAENRGGLGDGTGGGARSGNGGRRGGNGGGGGRASTGRPTFGKERPVDRLGKGDRTALTNPKTVWSRTSMVPTTTRPMNWNNAMEIAGSLVPGVGIAKAVAALLSGDFSGGFTGPQGVGSVRSGNDPSDRRGTVTGAPGAPRIKSTPAANTQAVAETDEELQRRRSSLLGGGAGSRASLLGASGRAKVK